MVSDYFLKKERKIHEFPSYDPENGCCTIYYSFSDLYIRLSCLCIA